MRARAYWLVALGALLLAACEPASDTDLQSASEQSAAQQPSAESGSGPNQVSTRPGTRGAILATPGSVDVAVGAAREVWRSSSGAPMTASPAVATGLLVAGFADFSVRGLSTDDGIQIWLHESGSLPVSVAVSTAGLFVAEVDAIVRLSPVDGSVIWTIPFSVATGTRMLATARAVYVSTSDGLLVAVGVETGDVIWSSDLDPASEAPAVGAIVAANGILYLCTADGAVAAVVAADGGSLWTQHLGSALSSGPAMDANNLFVVTEEGTLFALARQTGEQIPLAVINEPVVVSVVGSGENIIAIGAAGGVFRVSPDTMVTDAGSPSDPLLPVLRLGPDLAGQPALLDSVILVADAAGTLRGLDGDSARELWSVPLHLRASGEMAYDGVKVYIGGVSGEIVALVPDLPPDYTSLYSEDRLWDIPETGEFRMAARIVTFQFIAAEDGVVQWSVGSSDPDDELVVTILNESASVLATNMGKVALQRFTRVAVDAGQIYQLRVERPHPDPETVVSISSQRIQ